MNKTNRVSAVAFALLLTLVLFVNSVISTQASEGQTSYIINDGALISEVFPDKAFAKKVAGALGKEVTSSVTQSELDSLQSLVIVTGGTSIESIEGVQYFRELKNLIIYGTQVSELPEEMEQLTMLKSMQINANELTTVPAWVGNLVNLEKLTFFQNQIETFDADLENMTNLKELALYDNKITIFDKALPISLEKIDLHGNQLSVIDDNFVLPSLKALIVHNNEIQSITSRLDEIETLEELSINNNMIGSKVPEIALKPGQISGSSLENHNQSVDNGEINVYKNQEFLSEALMNDFLVQIREDYLNSGKSFSTFGQWAYREVGINPYTYIQYEDGSELNKELFEVGKSYEISFNTTNRSMRNWGYSSYRTLVNFKDINEGYVTFNYLDENGNELAPSESLKGEVGVQFDIIEKVIPGYTNKTLYESIDRVFKDEEVVINIVYSEDVIVPTKGTITLSYVDVDGNMIAPQEVLSGNVGEPYITTPKQIEGYIFKEAKGPLVGVYELETTVTYIYAKTDNTTEPEVPVVKPKEDDTTEPEVPIVKPKEDDSTEPEVPVVKPKEDDSTEVEVPVVKPKEDDTTEPEVPVVNPKENESTEVEVPVVKPEVDNQVVQPVEVDSTSVKTGVNTNMITLVAVAVGALCISSIYYKKSRKSNKA